MSLFAPQEIPPTDGDIARHRGLSATLRNAGDEKVRAVTPKPA